MGKFHLSGPVIVDDETVLERAWVEGDVLRFGEPASGPWEAIEGFVVPGLVDVHCHIGLDSGGAVEPAP